VINREKTQREMSFGQDRIGAGSSFAGSVHRLEPDMVDKVARVWGYLGVDFIPANNKLGYGACALWEAAGGHFSALRVSLDDLRLAMACSPLKVYLERRFHLCPPSAKILARPRTGRKRRNYDYIVIHMAY
jgi:hypothetical protein